MSYAVKPFKAGIQILEKLGKEQPVFLSVQPVT